MAFTNQPYEYQRGVPPASPESQIRYYQEELRKLERSLTSVVMALKELEARVAAGNL